MPYHEDWQQQYKGAPPSALGYQTPATAYWQETTRPPAPGEVFLLEAENSEPTNRRQGTIVGQRDEESGQNPGAVPTTAPIMTSKTYHSEWPKNRDRSRWAEAGLSGVQTNSLRSDNIYKGLSASVPGQSAGFQTREKV